MSPLQVDMVVIESLVHSSQNSLGHLLAPLQGVVPVTQDLRLHYGDYASSLTCGSVPCQNISILHDSLIARDVFTNFQNTAPLCKLTTIGLVLLASFVQVIQPLGGPLPLAPKQLLHALVHLDAGDNAFGSDKVDERCPIISFLVESFVEENDPADWLDPLLIASEQELPVGPAVVLSILQATACKSLAYGTGRFISSKDPFSGSDYSLSNSFQLFLQLRRRVVEIGRHFPSEL